MQFVNKFLLTYFKMFYFSMLLSQVTCPLLRMFLTGYYKTSKKVTNRTQENYRVAHDLVWVVGLLACYSIFILPDYIALWEDEIHNFPFEILDKDNRIRKEHSGIQELNTKLELWSRSICVLTRTRTNLSSWLVGYTVRGLHEFPLSS